MNQVLQIGNLIVGELRPKVIPSDAEAEDLFNSIVFQDHRQLKLKKGPSETIQAVPLTLREDVSSKLQKTHYLGLSK